MAYRVCHLTLVQAREFESKGVEPNCDFHRHVSINEAHLRVARCLDENRRPIEGFGRARWVGDRYRMICDVPSRTPRACRGVMQWVLGDVAGRKGQFHYPIPAVGAKDMTARMHVNQINREVDRGSQGER